MFQVDNKYITIIIKTLLTLTMYYTYYNVICCIQTISNCVNNLFLWSLMYSSKYIENKY